MPATKRRKKPGPKPGHKVITTTKKTKPGPKPKAKPTSLELFLDLLAGIFPEDKLTPGVVLSHLNQGAHAGEWYGAAYRYPGERNQFNYLKRVRVGEPAFGASIEEVVMKLASPWTRVDLSPVRNELRKRAINHIVVHEGVKDNLDYIKSLKAPKRTVGVGFGRAWSPEWDNWDNNQ
jgi:hypothetical protein